jgi:hypothetical protein
MQRETVLAWFGSMVSLVAAHKHEVLDADIAPLAPQDFD